MKHWLCELSVLESDVSEDSPSLGFFCPYALSYFHFGLDRLDFLYTCCFITANSLSNDTSIST